MTTIPKDVEFFLRRALSDTGFFCREVLGMDTDRDVNGNALSEVGKGGVRSFGPHQELVNFMDDFSVNRKVILAPRFSYKSSIVKGLIERCLLAYPNYAILLMMHDKDMAINRVQGIRDELENNPIIRELFPNVKGPLWRQDSFITGLRTDLTLQTPSLVCGSPEKVQTGIRANLIIFDDIVADRNCRTTASIQKVNECIRRCMYLRAKGAIVMDVGTPYVDGDGHDFLLSQPGWERLTHLDIGYEVIERADGTWDLQGEARWPHLKREFLLENFTDYVEFMAQYKLRVVGGKRAAFRRRDFVPVAWKDDFKQQTGYLLTDLATSEKPESREACLDVLLYIILDERNRLTILDAQVGRWAQHEFCQRLLDMRDRWSGRVNHQAELFEGTPVYPAYRTCLTMMARDRKVRLNLVEIPRAGTSIQSKDMRIYSISYRFHSSEVQVCDTVPAFWTDHTRNKELWVPGGYVDPETHEKLPAGELVDQFIRFPRYPLKDIPDTLAMVDEVDRGTGRRYCFYRAPNRSAVPESGMVPGISSQGRPTSRGFLDRFYDRAIRGLGRR